MYILIAVAVLAIFYLFLIMPAADKTGRLDKLMSFYYAHRGLHDGNVHTPENSLKAFALASQKGYGMELDVQLTADGEVVVFHDDDTKRMCGIDKKISQMDYAEIKSLKLVGTDEGIPLLSDMLKVVDGKTPLIVELKPYNDHVKLCIATDKILADYNGDYCVESFNPLVVSWYRKNRPNIIRGQLSCHFDEKDIRFFLVEQLITNVLTRPNFIAYDHVGGGRLPVLICRKLFGCHTIAWTLKKPADLTVARQFFDGFIFEGFTVD